MIVAECVAGHVRGGKTSWFLVSIYSRIGSLVFFTNPSVGSRGYDNELLYARVLLVTF